MTNDEDLPICWDAWVILHNSHGLSLDTLVWLPTGNKPEGNEDWVRLEQLDITQMRPFPRRSDYGNKD